MTPNAAQEFTALLAHPGLQITKRIRPTSLMDVEHWVKSQIDAGSISVNDGIVMVAALAHMGPLGEVERIVIAAGAAGVRIQLGQRHLEPACAVSRALTCFSLEHYGFQPCVAALLAKQNGPTKHRLCADGRLWFRRVNCSLQFGRVSYWVWPL